MKHFKENNIPTLENRYRKADRAALKACDRADIALNRYKKISNAAVIKSDKARLAHQKWIDKEGLRFTETIECAEKISDGSNENEQIRSRR